MRVISGGQLRRKGRPTVPMPRLTYSCMRLKLVEALGVFSAHWGQDHRAKEGEPNLAAVGVAGEHKVDEGTAWVGDDVVGKVRFVGHEKHWAVGFGGDGEI